MFKYTKYLLQKLEELFEEIGYSIRYERGTFQSGYCLVFEQKIAVINKFYDTEARINCLLEILEKAKPNVTELSEAAQKTYKKVEGVLIVEVADA